MPTPEVVIVILSACCPATQSFYAGRWNRFITWCVAQNVDPVKACFSEVLCVALSLALLGYAVDSVKGYFAALSVGLCLLDQPHLLTSLIVIRLLK